MINTIIQTQKTESGKNAIGIGGGAYTNTFTLRTVLRKTGSLYTVKPALFIRKNGIRACQLDQGLTEIEPGDLIVESFGYLPVDPNNQKITINAYTVTGIVDDHAIVMANNEITVLDLPYSVIHGAGIYHNRDGSFFAGGIIS